MKYLKIKNVKTQNLITNSPSISIWALGITIKTILFSVLLFIHMHSIAVVEESVDNGLPSTEIKSMLDDVIFNCPDGNIGEKELLTLTVDTFHSANKDKLRNYSQCIFSKDIKSIYISTWSKGKRQRHLWSGKPKTAQSLVKFMDKFKNRLQSKKIKKIHSIELHFTYNYQQVNYQDHKAVNALMIKESHGITGIELRYKKKIERYPSTYSIINNRKHKDIINKFVKDHDLSRQQIGRDITVSHFDSDKYLINLEKIPDIKKLYRADSLIPVSAVTKDNTEKWISRASDWMLNNVHNDGRMTYYYYPSEQREELRWNNLLRQTMASLALTQIANRSYGTVDADIAEKNIDYNLKKFYRKNDGHGFVRFSGKVKLGANALMVAAINAHPKRNKWKSQEMAMRKLIRSLWHEDGSFQTFFLPKGRTGQDNYYPGEALFLWGILYKQERDPEIYRMFMKSFEYYRDWHMRERNRNPAFIPWHTEAYYMMWEITKNPELAEFIFEMNDWLIDIMQQWEGDLPYKDTWGRFFSPRHPYGPPHASATGVNLEGLIDAFKLAKKLDDTNRIEKYRVAIIRAIRSLMQLQYKNSTDMFYIKKSDRKFAYGGVRISVDDNFIRCDNVQHALMGMFKVVDAFKPEDYIHPDESPLIKNNISSNKSG